MFIVIIYCKYYEIWCALLSSIVKALDVHKTSDKIQGFIDNTRFVEANVNLLDPV